MVPLDNRSAAADCFTHGDNSARHVRAVMQFMIWIKSALVGFFAAFVTIVAIVIATTMWWVDVGEGSGSIGFFSFGLSALLLFPAALAFAMGFGWMFRRQRHKANLKVGTTTV